MEITRPHHESGLGIYALSVPVESKQDWNAAEEVANEMIFWMNQSNGSFKGEFNKAFAMAHCQVMEGEKPWQLFVLDQELVVPKGKDVSPKSKQNLSNTFFEAQAIFNCEVLDAPDKIEREMPQRKVERDPNNKFKAEVKMEMVKKTISNIMTVPEACMSFPHRSERNVDRKYRIKVRYQWLGKGLLGGRKVETFEGWVEGLKAHIIQHETDHFAAKNIHFKS